METRLDRGISLIEMMVIILIIAVLLALFVGAVGSAREAGRRVQCANNMRNIGLGVVNFWTSKNRFPSAGTFRDDPEVHQGDPLKSTIYRAITNPSSQCQSARIVMPAAATMKRYTTQYGPSLFLGVVLLVALGGVPSRSQEPGDAQAGTPPVAVPDQSEPISALDSTGTTTPLDRLQDIKLTKISINVGWILIGGFLLLVFLLPGFALRETGSTPGTTLVRALGRDFALCALGTTGYWICGFALMFGGTGLSSTDGPNALDKMISFTIGGKPFDVLGARGFFLSGTTHDATIVAMFFFQMAFMMVAITIATGAMAGRWRLRSLCAYGLFFSMLLYPVYGAWVWGGGWLADLGVNFGLGNGHVDFAGSSVVHMTGGMAALAGAWILGPRIGRYGGDGSPKVIPCRSVTMVLLGTLILVLGPCGFIPYNTLFQALDGFGFSAGSTLAATDLRVGSIATCATLATLAGCLSSVLGTWIVSGKPNVIKGCNGLLAGAVAIAGPCAFVDPLSAVVIGTLAGILVNGSVLFVERVLTVDDPIGAISVHGVTGGFGCLCIGLFANGTYGAGWNGVAAAPRGLFYGGGLGQLAAEVIGVGANFVWVFPSALACFWIVGKTIGNRIAAKPEN